MRRTLILVVALVGLAIAPAATAGGWATVGITPTPGPSSGSDDTTTYIITVLRHGVTPTDGATPAIVLTGADGKALRFVAKPTGETGRYSATVEWPDSGRWAFAVNDGLAGTQYGVSQTHRFLSDVTISPATGGGRGLSLPLGLGLGLAAIVATGLATLAWRRRRRPHPAPAITA